MKAAKLRIEIWFTGEIHREFIEIGNDFRMAKRTHKELLKKGKTGVVTDVMFYDADGDKIEGMCYSLHIKNNKWIKI